MKHNMTTQIRAHLKIEDALALQLLKEREKKPMGRIITELIQDSKQIKDIKRKIEGCV